MDQVGKNRERRKVTQLANTGNPDRVSLYVDSVCSAPLGPRSTFNNCAVDQLLSKVEYRWTGWMRLVLMTRGMAGHEL